MGLQLVTKPVFTAISLTDTKSRLRIVHEDEDDLIYAMIKEATQWSENIIHQRLCTQTWTYYLDKFPYGDVIYMPFPPIQSITTIKYYDTDNVLQTVSSSDYLFDSVSKPCRIDPVDGWPGTYDRFNAVEIEFICGYESEDLIPDDIKSAIYLRVADLYEHRQNTYAQPGLTSAVQNTETSYNILVQHIIFNSVV